MNLVTTMLINVINNSHNSVVDCDIAKYLIANHENINSLSISELAKNTNVSISQVSRFVRS
ncbi:MAG TPA: MurR/RpiR family transcriptional regulator, partial [Thomasclavelia ramosa]|nr:MurR/RpiR family transcriptional regulator [Thomasclavelia ramosa]